MKKAFIEVHTRDLGRALNALIEAGVTHVTLQSEVNEIKMLPAPIKTEPPLLARPNTRLIYTRVRGAKRIDIDASLQRLGLTRDQITSRKWAAGSPQHKIRMAMFRTGLKRNRLGKMYREA